MRNDRGLVFNPQISEETLPSSRYPLDDYLISARDIYQPPIQPSTSPVRLKQSPNRLMEELSLEQSNLNWHLELSSYNGSVREMRELFQHMKCSSNDDQLRIRRNIRARLRQIRLKVQTSVSEELSLQNAPPAKTSVGQKLGKNSIKETLEKTNVVPTRKLAGEKQVKLETYKKCGFYAEISDLKSYVHKRRNSLDRTAIGDTLLDRIVSGLLDRDRLAITKPELMKVRERKSARTVLPLGIKQGDSCKENSFSEDFSNSAKANGDITFKDRKNATSTNYLRTSLSKYSSGGRGARDNVEVVNIVSDCAVLPKPYLSIQNMPTVEIKGLQKGPTKIAEIKTSPVYRQGKVKFTGDSLIEATTMVHQAAEYSSKVSQIAANPVAKPRRVFSSVARASAASRNNAEENSNILDSLVSKIVREIVDAELSETGNSSNLDENIIPSRRQDRADACLSPIVNMSAKWDTADRQDQASSPIFKFYENITEPPMPKSPVALPRRKLATHDVKSSQQRPTHLGLNHKQIKFDPEPVQIPLSPDIDRLKSQALDLHPKQSASPRRTYKKIRYLDRTVSPPPNDDTLSSSSSVSSCDSTPVHINDSAIDRHKGDSSLMSAGQLTMSDDSDMEGWSKKERSPRRRRKQVTYSDLSTPSDRSGGDSIKHRSMSSTLSEGLLTATSGQITPYSEGEVMEGLVSPGQIVVGYDNFQGYPLGGKFSEGELTMKSSNKMGAVFSMLNANGGGMVPCFVLESYNISESTMKGRLNEVSIIPVGSATGFKHN